MYIFKRIQLKTDKTVFNKTDLNLEYSLNAVLTATVCPDQVVITSKMAALKKSFIW